MRIHLLPFFREMLIDAFRDDIAFGLDEEDQREAIY